ncbi:MAG: peptidoglycan-binding protein [Demequinaceae bacterium]|nr:peptidoglycan-binding protein [Demequinaceae bacterium]
MRFLKRLPTGLGVFVALTLIAPLIALTALAIKAANQSPLESASNPEPLIGAIEAASRDRQVAVAIKVEYADALSPTTDAYGTLTSVKIASGQTVTTGTVVATVNDARVIAYASATPLWRDLSRGTSGPDVRVGQQFLKAQGYYSGSVDGKVGYATEQAIKAFNKAQGFGSNNGVLSLSSLTWIGTGDVVVSEVMVHAGDSASPGTVLFTTTASLAAIVITETPNIPRDADVLLEVNDIVTPYVVGSGRVTEPGIVTAMASSLGLATDGTGSVYLAEPVTVGTVPSSALVVDTLGHTCFFGDTTAPGQVVQPQGGTIGAVDLDASLIGSVVLLNPREVREDLSCG